MRGNIERLPKWAQDELARLDREVAYLKGKLAVGPEDSDTFADPFASAPRPLGRGTRIRFTPKDAERAHFDVTLQDDGSLEVHADYMLAVIPQASNMIELRRVTP
jgi:hypothetical protein